MTYAPDTDEDDEGCSWIALSAATANVVTLLRLRKDAQSSLPGVLREPGAALRSPRGATNDAQAELSAAPLTSPGSEAGATVLPRAGSAELNDGGEVAVTSAPPPKTSRQR
jgi:hypothetical protein